MAPWRKTISGFDSYTLQARTAPAVVLMLPLLLFVLYLVNTPWVGISIPALGVVGIISVANELVRGRGRLLQERLVSEWDGLPTTRALRHRDSGDTESRRRLREAICQLTGENLPTAAEEASNPEQADTRYREAVDLAISVIRRDGIDASIVRHENARYGFRRNTCAVKGAAVGVILAGLAVNAVVLFFTSVPLVGLVVLLGHIALLLFWAFAVNDNWVKVQAETFSNHLARTVITTARAARPAR
ncbi:hypothetical protein ASF88_19295 [Leifsonia sp. Leaf336]|nr:hypothetical protein ASF88_19295 [Leifsonia sp. Leaf336]